MDIEDVWDLAKYYLGICLMNCAIVTVFYVLGSWIYILSKDVEVESVEVIKQITVEEILLIEEGFRSRAYLDSEGYVTIGIGTKLHKKKGLVPEDFALELSKEQAMELVGSHVAKIRAALENGLHGYIYNGLSLNRKLAIESMAYQIGVSGLQKFYNMWQALGDGCFEDAAREALNSQWANQTPGRAARHAEILRTGQLTDYEFMRTY